MAVSKYKELTWHWCWCRWCILSHQSTGSGRWSCWFGSASTPCSSFENDTSLTEPDPSTSPPADGGTPLINNAIFNNWRRSNQSWLIQVTCCSRQKFNLLPSVPKYSLTTCKTYKLRNSLVPAATGLLRNTFYFYFNQVLWHFIIFFFIVLIVFTVLPNGCLLLLAVQ